jgi:beta-glucosidase
VQVSTIQYIDMLPPPEHTDRGWRFPPDFHFGVATSAYQIEGATSADGRGPCVWDTFAKKPDAIERGETATVACDHYHRWREDVELMRTLGVSSYRFSIAWPRVQPEGRGPANRRGIAFYDQLVDALLAAGIRPFPTLYHWDLPQALEDRGGWPKRETIDRFADYACMCAQILGDRVTDWSLFNEPYIFVSRGYLLGRYAPGRREEDAFLKAVHNVVLAHGDGFRAIRSVRPKARVGTVAALTCVEPATDSEADRNAAKEADALFNLLFLDPVLHGGYPGPFAERVSPRDLGWKRGDDQRMRAPLDFRGVNCYYRLVIGVPEATPKTPFYLLGSRGDRRVGGGHAELGKPQQVQIVESSFGRRDGPRTEMGWEVWPRALYDVAIRLKRRYGKVPLEITESGCAFPDTPGPAGQIHDDARIAYHREHLAMVAKAMRDGVDIRSYHAWSLLDNFEWSSGYRPRFGLVRVNYDTLERTVKASGRWYANVCASREVM